jgi:hypothetical protein
MRTAFTSSCGNALRLRYRCNMRDCTCGPLLGEGSPLMTIQEAVDIAVEGGYHLHGTDGVATIYTGANSEFSAWTRTDNHSSFMISVHETFLDPAFWRALGRALGWEETCELAITCVRGQEECRRCHGSYWMYQWHCFIQHLANGQPPDTFFASLPHPDRAAGSL